MSKTSDEVRKNFKEADDIRDAGLTTPEDIIRFDDISYGTTDPLQVLDVYKPKKDADSKLPVIISVHGGGWVYGDKERYQYYCMSLAQRGFAVINFSYRLAPESQFPAPMEDTNLVCTWLMEHADTYGFDTDHIFAVGDSAGGHLLGLYAGAVTNDNYAKQYDFQIPQGFSFKAIALNCGVYKMEAVNRPNDMTEKLMEDFLPEKGSEKELKLVTVADWVTKNYPPTFVMTAVDDFLKVQAPIMVEKLTFVEVPFIYRIYGDANNRLSHVFHCNMRSEDAALCNDEECEFFKKYCR